MATKLDIGFDFLFLFAVSSWAKKDASVSASVRGDHLQGRLSAENSANSWLPWLQFAVHQSVGVLLGGFRGGVGMWGGVGWGWVDGWGESCTVWHIAAIRGGGD